MQTGKFRISNIDIHPLWGIEMRNFIVLALLNSFVYPQIALLIIKLSLLNLTAMPCN
jgi:hypothetical protein